MQSFGKCDHLLLISLNMDLLKAQVVLIDSVRARKCLADKYVVMLGDSTMSETMHDLVMLLSGVATKDEAMKEYMANATRCAADHQRLFFTINNVDAFVTLSHFEIIATTKAVFPVELLIIWWKSYPIIE